jgi:hypothetical protein
MNLNNGPTPEQLRDLLRGHDDLAGHHVLWARADGEVMLTCLRGEMDNPDARLRYDTFEAGMEYVGPEAALDEWWTDALFADMVRRWPAAAVGPGVTHVELSAVAPRGRPVGPEEVARIRPQGAAVPGGCRPVDHP